MDANFVRRELPRDHKARAQFAGYFNGKRGSVGVPSAVLRRNQHTIRCGCAFESAQCVTHVLLACTRAVPCNCHEHEQCLA